MIEVTLRGTSFSATSRQTFFRMYERKVFFTECTFSGRQVFDLSKQRILRTVVSRQGLHNVIMHHTLSICIYWLASVAILKGE